MIRLKKVLLPITFLFLLLGFVANVDQNTEVFAAGNINLNQNLAA